MTFQERNPLATMAYGLLLLAIVFGAVVALTGCQTLEPNTITPFLEHDSHASQHFGPHPTNYGYNEVGVQAHWDLPSKFYVEMAEGYNFAPKNGQLCAGLCGPREVFSARVGYVFKVKP